MIGITFDMASHLVISVLSCYLGTVDPSCRIVSPTTALIIHGSLGPRLIGGGGVIGLSFEFFFIGGLIPRLLIDIFILCRRMIVFRALEIDVPNVRKRLQISFCLYITCLFTTSSHTSGSCSRWSNRAHMNGQSHSRR